MADGDSGGARGVEHRLNGDFDLSLRAGYRPPPPGSEIARQVAELLPFALFFGGREDTALVDSPLPESWLALLEQAGVEHAAAVTAPSLNAGRPLAPFGWNADAAERARRYAVRGEHPPLEVVRRVNARTFSAAIEREIDPDSPYEGRFDSVAAVENFLRDASPAERVVKAQHANAGLGNRRLSGAGLDPATRRLVAEWCAGGDPVIVERWLPRREDLCLTFHVSRRGAIEDLEVHEMINTADGAFIGALFPAGRDRPVAQREALGRTAEVVARRLRDAGYFGPVCVDAFTWGDGGRLRPLADLNARRHVSAGALGLWRRWGREVTVYWRLFKVPRVRLPDPERWTAVLGPDAFDPGHRRGALPVSPPVDGAGRPCRRVAVLFAGRNREDVFAMERRMRERFER
ncbi:MAG: hypothetical protein Q9Q40_08700 [Acidobacteriota bacterium]|nr:hypothetical protein [Acidobacteriota bacterium]MDQ7088944.1 hypothetical protein [Acidobacteriota bacterium]